jgi:hypothetical protein
MKKTNRIVRRALVWSGMAVIAMWMQGMASAQTLVHEYSFSDAGPTNVADSIGGPAWNGIVLTGGTNALAGPGGSVFTGSQLLLSGSSEDFVQLPPGILSNYTAVTIDTWVTLGTLPANCFLWGFGDTDASGAGYNYIFCQPGDGRIAITAVDPGWQGEQNCGNVGSFAFATPTEIHVTAVFNPPAGYEELYTNGVLAVRNSAVTVQLNQISNVINYLGRSLYLTDGYYDSEWDEFRIWNGALNGLQVEACDVNGPNSPSDNYGTVTSVQLQIPYYQLVQGTHESATTLVTASGAPNPVDMSLYASYSSLNPSICTTTNNVIYAIGQGNASIVASFGGLSSTQIVSVVPPASVLVHEYSFNDANGGTTVADSIGGSAWNGTVMSNGANAVPTGGAFTNGMLWLNAAISNFVQLPSGILSNYSAVTIEGWVTEQTPMSSAYHAMYYAFGTTTSGLGYNYIFGSLPRVYTAITAGTYSSEQGTTEQDYALTTNTPIHWVAIYNPNAGYIALYTNGLLQSVNRSVTDPLSVVSPLEAFIGRSLYPGDPYASIALDEFRIYNGALTPQGIAISDAAGPNSIPAGVTNGPGSLLSLTLQAPSTVEAPLTAQLKLLANYTSLNNWDILGNSIFPPAGLTLTSSDTNVLWLDSNNVLHSQNPGQATITSVYQGTTNTVTITVTESAATPSLVHRYSFNDANGGTTVADSVGGPAWNGTVMSGGTNGVPTPGNFTNGLLYLSAAVSNYVQLPGGILSNYTAVTIESWANMTSFPVNSYLWSFGDTDVANTNTYSGGLPSGYDLIFCAPQAGNLTISGSDPSWQGGVGVNDQNWNGRTNFHLTAVFDPPAGYMAIYTNGVLAAINTSETIPMSSVSNVFSYIGRSLYYADPFATFNIDEFRIYKGVLSPTDVTVSQLIGPNQVLTTNARITATPSGNNLVLTWPEAASGFTLQSRTSLTSGSWTTVTPAAALVGGNWQATVPKTGGTQFFRLVR